MMYVFMLMQKFFQKLSQYEDLDEETKMSFFIHPDQYAK